MQDGQCGLVVENQDRLGDFQLQPVRAQTRCSKRRDNLQRKRIVPELNRRNVDRQPDVIRPRRSEVVPVSETGG